MLNTLQQLPLHEQLILTFLFGSILLCILLSVGGYLVQRARKASILPPVPIFPAVSFPTVFDYGYTFLFLIIFSVSIASVYFMPDPDAAESSSSWISMAVSLACQTCLYVPFLMRFALLPQRPQAMKSFWSMLPWCAVGLAAIAIPSLLFELVGGLEWLMETTKCPPQQDVVESFKAGTIEEKIIIALAAVIIAPLTEECCFRGFLYNILKQHSTRWIAIAASSLLFGAIHASIAQLLPLTLFAIVQCIAYDKARTLRLPIMIHASFNGISLLYILLFA